MSRGSECYLPGDANEGEGRGEGGREGVLIEGPYPVIIHNYYSFCVKEWEGVRVPVRTTHKNIIIIIVIINNK